MAKFPVIHSLPAKQSCRMIIHIVSVTWVKSVLKHLIKQCGEADLLIMVGTNYPYVDYLLKKNIKAIQIGHKS